MSPAPAQPPIPVAIIGDGSHALPETVNATTPTALPNLAVTVVTPIVAIFVRFANTYLTIVVGLVTAGLTSDAIPASDFYHLVLKCAGLAVAGAGVGLLKDLVTVFGKLEGKYPLLTGSI